MNRFIAIFLFISSFELSAASLQDLENYWGLSPLRKEFQHSLEGVRKKNKQLEVSVWYEDASITKNAIPDRELFCRFFHTFTYGKNVPRANRQQLPPTRAFAQVTDINEIRFYFFAILHRNQPTAPSWEKKPSPPEAEMDKSSQLRVLWTREEKAVPYLSLVVSRNEWSTVSELLKTKPYYAFSEFNQEVCDSLFRLMPRLRSNFSDLDQAQKNP